jgi:predicted lipid carrier protein YhbT
MNSPLQLPGPRLPLPLALPLRLMASRTHSSLLAKAMNRLLAPELADGELDFLHGRVLSIRVTDARVEYRLTLASDGLAAAAEQQPEDLSIEGSVYDFLLLATRREDADTLFFNRRLRLGGDTELGLYVKNFIDALELDARLGPLLKLLNGTTGLIGHLA